ncbi:cytochrome c oxidase subunit 2 [Rhizobium sp. BK619]|uniref:Heme/copper-type cytochrome/quinol oxidase, subunit 2 n=1 Tax=Rhizobium leguminosarum bv. trifolii WSM597 TaxID=754764 RepID=I9WYY6_RHILT|nr:MULTISPECIES: cytochrome c oxidase subunit II [Rhizobium]EJB01701.1 heme/copper-type cytochrome/quinol oxidase, subunit 2 [Rhizobium leguminosarum bv. trifolii WSM597]MBB3643898.1 cytochrome c oxidase subunit 2 [Rhizobium sp. BK619]
MLGLNRKKTAFIGFCILAGLAPCSGQAIGSNPNSRSPIDLVPGLVLPVSDSSLADPDLSITIIGYRHGWRYRIEQKDISRCFAGKVLVLPQGKIVQLKITSDDVVHEWAVPALNLKTDAAPGLLSFVAVDTKVAGSFQGGATRMSGHRYKRMEFELRIIKADAYQAWEKALPTSCEE